MTEVERQLERDAVRRKLASEKLRRQAMRAAMLRSPAERQAEVEECAQMPALPPSDAEIGADENTCAHDGRTLREALAWEMARASEFLGVPLPIDATSLAVAMLTSHDYAYGLDVEALPQHAATFGRLWGHLYAIGLAIDPHLAASVVRRCTRLLLDRARFEAARPAASTAPMPTADVSLAAVPTLDGRFALAELPDEPVDATPPREPPAEVEATHARKLAGYVRLREDVSFRGAAPMRQGLVVEHLAPTESEQEELTRSQGQGRVQLVVWWDGRPRFVPASLVERVNSDAWWAQNEGQEDPDE